MTNHCATCPGCGRVLNRVSFGGLALLDGRAIPYSLCDQCASDLRRDPEQTIERVERALLGKKPS